MAPEIVTELHSNGPTGGTGGTGGPTARPIISQTVQSGSGERGKPSESTSSGNTIENTVRAGGGRVLSESTRRLLANLDAPTTSSPPAAAGLTDAGAAPTAAPPATPPSPAAAVVAPAASSTAPPTTAPPAPEHERLTTRNRELAAEVERLKASPKREPSKREKVLDEIERGYLDNPVEAIRKLQALALGYDDHKHADIDSEMKGLYQDLTSRELGVSTDTSQQALRETARTKALLAREQRERKAEQEAASKPPESSEDKQAAEHVELIGSQLKSIGDRYPMTMSLAQEFHGMKPEALLLKVIRSGFATGEFDPKDTDDKLIDAAAKKTEALYQALADKFGKARPSTATPSPAAEIPNNAASQGQGARSITNANASVAPATPPAKPETPAKPKYRNEDERRKAIVRGHMPD